jgi:hypothetical protein
MRPHLDDATARALKVASKALVAACGGGEAAAAACRLGPSHLSEAGAMHQMDRFLPIDVVVALERAGEAHPVTSALARLVGCILVPVEPRGAGELPMLLAQLGREVGDVFAASAKALADGQISEDERAELVVELGQMMAVAHQALAALGPAEAAVLPLRRRPA